jgi:hypothetical protein
MQRAIMLALGATTACTPRTTPVEPEVQEPAVAPESVETKAQPRPTVAAGEIADGGASIALDGMIVPTHPRDERTVEALRVSLLAGRGKAWLDLRLTPEVSDDAGFDYLHCHTVELRTKTVDAQAGAKAESAWSATVSSRHTTGQGGEVVEARVSVQMLRRLAQTEESGGRVCEDAFTLSAAQKSKLLELVDAIGPITDAGGASEFDPEPIDKIGIAECDEYLVKYRRCMQEHAPEAARQAVNEALEATLKVWREAANGPGRDGLATACKAAFDAAKQATAAMGCEW